MERINDKIAHKYLFQFSPSLYKSFWARKFGFLNNNFSKMEREVNLLPLFMHEKSVFVDIGANLGLYLYWAEKLKVNQVLAIEPIPFLHKKLAKIFPNFLVKNLALSNSKGRMRLNIPITASGLVYTRATLVPTDTVQTKYEEVEVETDTLDNVCSIHNIVPTFIKIDVEGAENWVLEGASKLIHEIRPSFMIEIEARSNSMYDETFGRFFSANYQCFYLDPRSLKVCSFEGLENIQRLEDFGTKNYVNNFIFVPSENTTLINSLIQYELY